MNNNLSGMAHLELILFLCSMVTFMVGNCETKSENSNKDVNLPGFLSESNLSDTGAFVENEESLRKLVKRLAPEKNGEYQIYQVFFGNADLLKEWLKGAGVTGQPGVDFPALTTIPATSFSCRGLKGGYYADLDTNCQVFHICDNGRKISFLCPNGTIFQQSQLICDWWFKVDCSKSAELYEQSSEQFLEDEKRRAESRKSKPDYQQSIEGEQQDYYDVQNLNYDGKQNGRIKPYEEPPQENQVQPNRERLKPSRHFDSGNNFNQESNAQKESNQLFESNGYQSKQSPSLNQQFSQYRGNEEGNTNRHQANSQEHYSNPKKSQNYNVANRNQNNQRDDKGALKRLKFKGLTRNNTLPASRPTPAYTESTTFRASNTSPVKESQQFAESAAFVGRSGSRFNDNTGNTHQYYYQVYINRDSSTRNPNYDSTTWRQDNENDVSTQRPDFVPYTDGNSTPYETTTIPCNDEITTENGSSSTNFDTQSPTESLQVANSNYEYRGNGRETGNARSFVDKNSYNNRVSDAKIGTIPSTTRSYVTTDVYRQNTLTPSSSQQRYTTNYFSPTPTAYFRSSSFGRTTERPVTRNTNSNQFNKFSSDGNRGISKNPSTASPGYRQNLVSTTTDKPRTTSGYQPNTVTEKDLSPYDRSFTYKQGKVMSTLGPYVPFTKNYASTTSKPVSYAPTVPTYTTTYTSPKPRLKYPAPTSLSKIKPNAGRLSERQHAISMLNSLKNLENSVPNLSDALKETGRTYNVSVAPAVSTLHSLALYFSTATENFDSNETTDSSVDTESSEELQRFKESNRTINVPASILTQHTLNSYAELFKLNDAAEPDNTTMEDRLDNSNGYDDYEDDLELQQSAGPLDDLRRSNSTRLRELAQVFTHALSAYLLDPDAFKKVLTEIRPTEPTQSTEETDDEWGTTTVYPFDENNALLIKERDEVLDYSEDTNDIRQKLTTIYPTTFESTTTTDTSGHDTLSTLPTSYYTTPKISQDYTTNFVSNTYTETTLPPTENTTTVEQNTPYESESSRFPNQNVESTVTDNYDTSEDGAQNRVGGFQNNSATTVTESYEEKLLDVTPASDNYVVSPTPSPPLMHVHMVNFNWNKKSSSKKPEQQLTPPLFESYLESIRKDNDKIVSSLNPENYPSTPISTHATRATTFGSTKSYETSTVQPRKASRHKSLLSESKSKGISRSKNVHVRVDTTTMEPEKVPTSRITEPVTATTNGDVTPCDNTDSSEPLERVNDKETKDDHWTSSPVVTNLWKSTVFVDPQRINHDLGLDSGSTVTSGTFAITDSQEYGSTRSLGEDISSSSEESFIDDEDLPPPAQRLSRDKDSPTTFSLLPTSFTTENTATTPRPLITAKSSITATITSTITSTKTLPQDNLVSLLPQATLNGTENEIADKLFGKLNASSANTLMRVMKEVDSNETVRQLVLLLIRHCSDPTNRTMQREKDELLNALLKLPVTEFSSEESRNIVAGINQLSVPVVRSTDRTRNTTPVVVTEPPVTTFRSRKSRKFRTTTESSPNIVRRSEKEVATDGNNSLQEDEASASDNRALELLRSLYTIATKWG